MDAKLIDARQVLNAIVANPAAIQALGLTAEPGKYSRKLLYSENAISVWALVWSPGCRTSIHDHHCACCFGMVSGSLQEVRFRAIDDHRAIQTSANRREAGFVASMLPTGPNIHQMINDTEVDAISVHIYGFDPEVHANSIEREYTAVAL